GGKGQGARGKPTRSAAGRYGHGRGWVGIGQGQSGTCCPCPIPLVPCPYSVGLPTGKEPRTEIESQAPSSDLRAFLTFGSSWWPSKSAKKTYSPFASRNGNDSIHVRLILFDLNTCNTSASDPGVCGTWKRMAVLSSPVRAESLRAMTAKRVSFSGWSSMLLNRTRSP